MGSANGSLIVKPRWHRKGRLPVRDVHDMEKCLQGRPQFRAEQTAVSKSMVKPKNMLKEIDFAALGMTREEFTHGTVTYKLKAGDMAMHHPASPQCSMPNTTKDR